MFNYKIGGVALSSYVTSLKKFTNFPGDLLAGRLFYITWECIDQLEKDGSVYWSEIVRNFLSRLGKGELCIEKS